MLKLKLIAKYLIIPLIFTGVVSINPIQPSLAQQQTRGRASFFCDRHNGSPATIVNHSKRGKLTFIIWDTLYFGDDYPPEERCRVVSARFQQTNINGDLNYIVSGTLNNYPVLCASRSEPTNQVINCSNERLLMTLQPGDNSQAMIEHIAKLNRGRSSVDPLMHSANILQKSPNGSLVAIDVGIMLRYSEETENLPEPTNQDPNSNDCLFGICE